MKNFFIIIFFLFLSSFQIIAKEREDAAYISEKFIECPNLYDALLNYEIVSHQINILNNDLRDIIEVLIVKKDLDIYRYILIGYDSSSQSCSKLFRSESEFLDNLTNEERIKLLKDSSE